MRKNHPTIMLAASEKGFTLIELLMVIVILGILAVVAIPKYSDMRTEAAAAAADGVFGAAQGATAINFAAGLVGKAAANRPAYDATTCAAATITTGACLLNALDSTPEGWSASGKTITATVSGTTYTITITSDESSTAKAVLSKSW